jgi:hypothetical protein
MLLLIVLGFVAGAATALRRAVQAQATTDSAREGTTPESYLGALRAERFVDEPGEHLLTLEPERGVEAYAFTFG